jgi:hypothetical protein
LKRRAAPFIQAVLLFLPALLLSVIYLAYVTFCSATLPSGEIVKPENSRIGLVSRASGHFSREVPPLGPNPDSVSGFSSITFNRYNVRHQIARYSTEGRLSKQGTYIVGDPLYSGWFTPEGCYVWVKHVTLGGKSTPWLYAIDSQDQLSTHDLSGAVGNTLPLVMFGLKYPVLARADETGGWLVVCDGQLGTIELKIVGEPSSEILPPGGFAELLNSSHFKRRFADFGLSTYSFNKRDRINRIKYGADVELYTIDRNGSLWRITKKGKLIRLSGGVMHRLLGNAPTKPPVIPAYGPWEGSRAAFAVNSSGNGRQFDPYNGVLYVVNPKGGLDPLYALPVVIDKKKWTDSPYKAPGWLLLGGERQPAQWDLLDSPSSTLDESGNFYVYLDRLLLFPSEAQ